VVACFRLDQLGGNAQAFTGLAHGTFQHVFYFQQAGDFTDVLVLAFELEGRSARRDVDARVLRQHVQQFFGNAVREEFLFGIGGEVDERQDSNGFFGGYEYWF